MRMIIIIDFLLMSLLNMKALLSLTVISTLRRPMNLKMKALTLVQQTIGCIMGFLQSLKIPIQRLVAPVQVQLG